MGFDPNVAQRGIGSPWDALILAEAGDAGTAALVKGVVAQESEWDPNAQNPSDPSVGLMQILVGSRGPYPSYTSLQLLDPSTNLILGITFLKSLLARYSTSDALSAYNAGHPSRLSAGGYSNQAYVDSVNTYAVWYMNNDPLLTGVAPVDTSGAPTDTASAPVDTGTLAVGGLVLLGLAGAILLAARRR